MKDPKLNLPKRQKDPRKIQEENPDDPRIGQGFNDARGEIPDKEDIPKNNGQNVRNDPAQAKPHPSN